MVYFLFAMYVLWNETMFFVLQTCHSMQMIPRIRGFTCVFPDRQQAGLLSVERRPFWHAHGQMRKHEGVVIYQLHRWSALSEDGSLRQNNINKLFRQVILNLPDCPEIINNFPSFSFNMFPMPPDSFHPRSSNIRWWHVYHDSSCSKGKLWNISQICEVNCYQTISSPICSWRCVVSCIKMLKFNSCGKSRKNPAQVWVPMTVEGYMYFYVFSSQDVFSRSSGSVS